MQVCKYFPVANDRMGTIWTLASIEGACVIEFGPAGTTHYGIEAIGSLNGQERANIYSTHMDQNDVTFGKLFFIYEAEETTLFTPSIDKSPGNSIPESITIACLLNST